MTVEKVKYTYMIVADMDRAVAFYRDALGLSLQFQDGSRWAQFDAGGGTVIALSAAEESRIETAGPVVVLQATEAEALAATLEAHGGEIIARRDMGNHGRLIAFRDPCGNSVQIYEKPGS